MTHGQIAFAVQEAASIPTIANMVASQKRRASLENLEDAGESQWLRGPLLRM